MQKYLSNSDAETKAIAAGIAKENKGRVFALSGELGAGKTTFVQGFAKGLGIQEKIISPTFVLIRQHPIPGSKKVLYHIDLYRMDETPDLAHLGLKEIWLNPDNIILIEWAEKIEKLLPKNALKINITKPEEGQRLITIL